MSTRKTFSTPQEALRYHVTGAIERGEGVAIVEKRALTREDYARLNVDELKRRERNAKDRLSRTFDTESCLQEEFAIQEIQAALAHLLNGESLI